LFSITRRTIHQFRVIARKTLNIHRGVGPPIVAEPAEDGLLLRVSSHEAAVELRLPSDAQGESICVPFQFLDDCQAKNDEPVTLTLQDGQVVVQWTDGSGQQLVQYDQPEPSDGFPAMPAELTENPPSLLKALRDACETTDPDSCRYSLGCVQLHSENGRVVATDGHQLLVQSGFMFSWDGDILVPANKVYGCSCLPSDQTVHVGCSEEWFTFVTGPWTLHFKLNVDGRFPKVEDHIRQAGSATTTLRLTDQDASFLTDTIRRLPRDDTVNSPVTVDLNGQVAVRAKGDDQAQATELVLSNSSRDGKPVRFNSNRQFLARAAKLGFREIELDGAEAPAHCRDDTRVYVWAVLGKDDPVKAGKHINRIQSPAASEPAVKPTANRITRSQTPTMSAPKTNSNGNGRSTQAAATEPEVASPVEQAEALRDSLNDALGKTRELIRSLKRQKKQSRIVESTLASLRQLQSVDL